MTDRKVVIPGEVIAKGADYLPGEGTEKRGEEIVAIKFGLSEEFNKLIKVIPLSGGYQPRRGNIVIGKVDNITFNGWVIDLGVANSGFLPVSEVPKYVNKNDLEEVLDFGDMVVAQISEINKRGIDLTIRSRGLGRLDRGIIMEVNPNRVPRVIGKEGSMISLIKGKTGCRITVGQNGLIWIDGDKVEDELFAKKAIMHVAENSFVSGLTDEMNKWFDKEKKQ